MGEILTYVLIIVALSLAGMTGMQFFYMVLLERRDREQKKRIHDLEQRCLYLAGRINAAEGRRKKSVLSPLETSAEDSTKIEDDLWADFIEER